MLAAKSALMQAQFALESDTDTYLNTKEQLNELLGRDIDTDFSVEALPGSLVEQISLANARHTALEQRPDVHQAKLQEAKANLAVRQEKAGYIPDVSAQITYINLQNINFLPESLSTAGFSMKWNNPWDWGKRHANIVGLRDAAKQQTLTVDDTRAKTLLDVDQKYRALMLSRRMVKTVAAAKEASAEQLRNITNQLHEHTALLSDVLKLAAQDQLQARNYTQALAEHWNALAAFDQALGRN